MRYLPLTATDRAAMCDVIGVKKPEDLFVGIPEQTRIQGLLPLPLHQPEYVVEQYFQATAAKNLNANDAPFFIGGGVYRHHIPAAVDALIQRGEFLTSYTPYQPEISQGTLQYLFEFQTQVAMLTGMDIANASLYDGSTACVEAIMMANRVTKKNTAILVDGVHPHYAEVAETYAQMTGFTVKTQSLDNITLNATDISCVVVQYPDFYGNIPDYRALSQQCKANGILLIAVCTEIVALGTLEPPAAWGADIVVAEGQSLGVPMSFGGPHVGLFACKQELLRQIPGRLCGQTVDTEGRRSWVLTLSTREQHIRRDKATSNICTNSGLCALAFSIHLSLLGADGLQKLAALNHAKAVHLAESLEAIGIKLLNTTFFNEFTVQLKKPAAAVVEVLAKQGILGGIPLSRFYRDRPNDLLLTTTELTTDADIKTLCDALKQEGC
jgi:glycine dehydrogenase subunit 1